MVVSWLLWTQLEAGFGVQWMMPRDLSSWTKLHVSLKSASAPFAAVDVGWNNMNPVFLHAAG